MVLLPSLEYGPYAIPKADIMNKLPRLEARARQSTFYQRYEGHPDGTFSEAQEIHAEDLGYSQEV